MNSFIKRYAGFFLLLGGIVGLILVNLFATSAVGVTTTAIEELAISSTTTTDGYIFVDVKGAVLLPGVYRMAAGSRIDEAIALAGGIRSDADLSMINGSLLISDEMVLIIPALPDIGTGADQVCVDVKGAVASPGVYCLDEGSRIGAALTLAGGVTLTADLMSINQAAKVTDEMVLYVPTKAETASVSTVSVTYAYVKMAGAIVRPGLYYVKSTSTVADLIVLAGGLKITGTTATLDLSAVVVTGMTLTVLTVEEAAELAETEDGEDPEDAEETTGLININTANLATLDTLYGIGPVLAQAIIDYRAENGNFDTIEDIMLVTGIKQSVYEQIADDITV